jgi:hypothetical protein
MVLAALAWLLRLCGNGGRAGPRAPQKPMYTTHTWAGSARAAPAARVTPAQHAAAAPAGRML